jgi:hypothetical protein
VITESYDGATVSVKADRVLGQPYVIVDAYERGHEESTLLYLTRDEALDLARALMDAAAEIDPVPAEAIALDVAQAVAVAAEVHGTEVPPTLASVLTAARDELLANSTPVAAAKDFIPCGEPTPGGPCDLKTGHPVGQMHPGHNGHMPAGYELAAPAVTA